MRNPGTKFILGNNRLSLFFSRNAAISSLFIKGCGYIPVSAKIGLFVNEKFLWLEPALVWSFNYSPEKSPEWFEARSQDLGVRIKISDILPKDGAVLLRKIVVFNNRNFAVRAKIFLNQKFDSRSLTKFSQDARAIISCSKSNYFLVSGSSSKEYFDSFSVGIAGERGLEGTWRDAEDGKLEQNSLAKGSTDSTISFSLKITPRSFRTIYFWVIFGHSLKNVLKQHYSFCSVGASNIYRRETARATFENQWIKDKIHSDFEPLFRVSLNFVKNALAGDGVFRTEKKSQLKESLLGLYVLWNENFLFPRKETENIFRFFEKEWLKAKTLENESGFSLTLYRNIPFLILLLKTQLHRTLDFKNAAHWIPFVSELVNSSVSSWGKFREDINFSLALGESIKIFREILFLLRPEAAGKIFRGREDIIQDFLRRKVKDFAASGNQELSLLLETLLAFRAYHYNSYLKQVIKPLWREWESIQDPLLRLRLIQFLIALSQTEDHLKLIKEKIVRENKFYPKQTPEDFNFFKEYLLTIQSYSGKLREIYA